MKEAFEVDKALYHDGYRLCYSFYQKIVSDFNIEDLDDTDVSQIINNKPVVEVSEQLSSAQSMKLTNFTHIQIFTKTSLVKLILVLVFLKQ